MMDDVIRESRDRVLEAERELAVAQHRAARRMDARLAEKPIETALRPVLRRHRWTWDRAEAARRRFHGLRGAPLEILAARAGREARRYEVRLEGRTYEPGEADAVRRCADAWRTLAKAVQRDRQRPRNRIERGGAGSAWLGPSRAEARAALMRLCRHEAGHAVLMEIGGCRVREVVVQEHARGRYAGHCAAEPGYRVPPWASYGSAGHEDATPDSKSDLEHVARDAAAAVAPGHDQWVAERHPDHTRVVATWRADAARALERHRTAVWALAQVLADRRHLNGDEVRRILADHGVC